MKTWRIGIDVDGVIGAEIEAILPMFNNYLGTSYTISDWDHWFFGRDKLDSNATLLSMFDIAWNQGLVLPQEPAIGKRIKALAKLGSITIITRRTYKSQSQVVKWLQEWGVKYDNFCFISADEEKLDWPIDVLIDDHPNFEYHKEKHPDKILLVRQQPWNLHDRNISKFLDNPNVRWVGNLNDAAYVLRCIAIDKENEYVSRRSS